MQYVDIDRTTVETFEDNGRVEQVLVMVSGRFGDVVAGNGDVILYVYDADGAVVQTRTIELDCYYDEDYSGVTICDIIIPSDLEIDRDLYMYELYFPKGVILGYGYTNNSFTADI